MYYWTNYVLHRKIGFSKDMSKNRENKIIIIRAKEISMYPPPGNVPCVRMTG